MLASMAVRLSVWSVSYIMTSLTFPSIGFVCPPMLFALKASLFVAVAEATPLVKNPKVLDALFPEKRKSPEVDTVAFNAGSLLADGVTFDGSDDVLTSINSSLTNYTFAGVYTVKTIADNTGFLGKGAGASDREFFVRMKSDGKVEHRVYSTGSASTFDTISSSASAISADTTALIAGSFNGSTNAIRLDVNSTVLTATSSVGLYAATSNLTIPSALGSEAHTAIAELVFYNTDQSGKLSDIKTNINGHYSIF